MFKARDLLVVSFNQNVLQMDIILSYFIKLKLYNYNLAYFIHYKTKTVPHFQGFVITFLIFALSVVRTALYFSLNAALGGLCLVSDIWYGYLAAVALQLWNLNAD